jgi:hypothetical protein
LVPIYRCRYLSTSRPKSPLRVRCRLARGRQGSFSNHESLDHMQRAKRDGITLQRMPLRISAGLIESRPLECRQTSRVSSPTHGATCDSHQVGSLRRGGLRRSRTKSTPSGGTAAGQLCDVVRWGDLVTDHGRHRVPGPDPIQVRGSMVGVTVLITLLAESVGNRVVACLGVSLAVQHAVSFVGPR